MFALSKHLDLKLEKTADKGTGEITGVYSAITFWYISLSLLKMWFDMLQSSTVGIFSSLGEV